MSHYIASRPPPDWKAIDLMDVALEGASGQPVTRYWSHPAEDGTRTLIGVTPTWVSRGFARVGASQDDDIVNEPPVLVSMRAEHIWDGAAVQTWAQHRAWTVLHIWQRIWDAPIYTRVPPADDADDDGPDESPNLGFGYLRSGEPGDLAFPPRV